MTTEIQPFDFSCQQVRVVTDEQVALPADEAAQQLTTAGAR